MHQFKFLGWSKQVGVNNGCICSVDDFIRAKERNDEDLLKVRWVDDGWVCQKIRIAISKYVKQ